MLRAVAALAAALLALPAWAQPAVAPLLPAEADRATMLLLPPDWRTGDAAVLLLVDRTGSEHHALVNALLAEGAAVAEHHAPQETPALALVPDLLAIVSALRRDAGAGPLIALGWGAGGDAALLATLPKLAKAETGMDGPRLAGAARLRPHAAFAAGEIPDAAEGWPARIGLLCAVLTATAGAPERECRTGMLREGRLASH